MCNRYTDVLEHSLAVSGLPLRGHGRLARLFAFGVTVAVILPLHASFTFDGRQQLGSADVAVMIINTRGFRASESEVISDG